MTRLAMCIVLILVVLVPLLIVSRLGNNGDTLIDEVIPVSVSNCVRANPCLKVDCNRPKPMVMA